MNTQESAQLSQFLSQLADIKLTEKDAAAESLISQAVSRQPDAAYLLVQRCLLQNQALQAAHAQIADLQHQLQQKNTNPSSNSFLNSDPWAVAANNSQGVPGASNYRMPAMANPEMTRVAPQNPAAGFGSSFLGNVATTAAGVVAGSFLFQGIGNLLGHHQSASGLGQQAFNEHPTEQTVINNYYDDDKHDNQHLASDHDQHDNLHLASDDDSGSFFDDNDTDSDWI